MCLGILRWNVLRGTLYASGAKAPVKVLLQSIGCLALLAVAWLAGESAYTVRYARQRSVYTFDQVNKVLRESSQTMDEVRKAATVWEKASTQQASQTTQAMSSVTAAATQLTVLLSKTDKSLNSELLPSLKVALESENASLLESQADLQEELQQMSLATQQANKVLADADARITDPSIQKTLDNVAASSTNLATATREGAGMLKDAHEVEQYEIKQIEAPVTKVKLVWHAILDVIRHLYF